ncbi:MAG: DJ-1/PfpI family protein [Candidatus Woesearchaeota archaeon]|jgi:protease I
MIKALFVVAQRGYQDQEYGVPKQILEEKGIEVVTASKEGGTCVGAQGGMIKDSISLADVKIDVYNLIVFIGGSGAQAYSSDEEALNIAREGFNHYKLLGAICIAPIILARSGVLRGRKATVWNKDGRQEAILSNSGAKYTGEAVTVDGKIVTANGPEAASEFARTLLRILKI